MSENNITDTQPDCWNVYSNAMRAVLVLKQLDQLPIWRFQRECEAIVFLYEQVCLVREDISGSINYETLPRVGNFTSYSFLELATNVAIEAVFPTIHHWVNGYAPESAQQDDRMSPGSFVISVLKRFNEQHIKQDRSPEQIEADRLDGHLEDWSEESGPALFYNGKRLDYTAQMRKEIIEFAREFNRSGDAQYLFKSLGWERRRLFPMESNHSKPYLDISLDVLKVERAGYSVERLTEREMDIFKAVWASKEEGMTLQDLEVIRPNASDIRQLLKKKLYRLGLVIDSSTHRWIIREVNSTLN